jgi:N-formylglutamate deformylase
MKTNSNIILHIPHSSTYIPLVNGYVTDEKELKNELNLLTDWFTDELFDLPCSKIVAPFSRLFCDVERFADDAKEIMAQYGMGMCYTHLDDGKLMRNVDPELRMKIRSDYYDVHHNNLELLTSEKLSGFNKAFIIDCHSFEDTPNQRDLDKDMPRPDFCIGADEFHTTEKLTFMVRDYLIKQGYTVMINKPYSGTLIPAKYQNLEKNVTGIMIEVNRKLYMTKNSNSVEKNRDFEIIKNLMSDVVKEICQF